MGSQNTFQRWRGGRRDSRTGSTLPAVQRDFVAATKVRALKRGDHPGKPSGFHPVTQTIKSRELSPDGGRASAAEEEGRHI